MNSRHHQAVKDLAGPLAPVAASPDDVVEAFERPGPSWLAAVQWHPEDLVADPRQKALFRVFLEASRAYAKAHGRATPPLVEVSLEGAIAVVKLARPGARNAFAGDMADLLAGTLVALGGDPTAPALVLTGAPPWFSAGLDVELLAALAAAGDENGFLALLDAMGAPCVPSWPSPTGHRRAGRGRPRLGPRARARLRLRVAGGSAPFEAELGPAPGLAAPEAGCRRSSPSSRPAPSRPSSFPAQR